MKIIIKVSDKDIASFGAGFGAAASASLGPLMAAMHTPHAPDCPFADDADAPESVASDDAEPVN